LPHIVEIWETMGPKGTVHTAAATCLACGWFGEGREMRPVAAAEGEAREAAEAARIEITRGGPSATFTDRPIGDRARGPPDPLRRAPSSLESRSAGWARRQPSRFQTAGDSQEETAP